MHLLGKLGCAGFISATLLHLLLGWTLLSNPTDDHLVILTQLIGISLITLLVCVPIGWRIFNTTNFLVIWRAQLLGVLLALGLSISLYDVDEYFSLGWYILVMSFFHFSEFVVTSIIRPQNLSTDSFLLNHSKAYGLAAVVSWLEYLLELWCFPIMKRWYWPSFVGLVLCISGEAVRKTAMLTAGSNFDHLIRTHREDQHRLVTSGIYSLCRHPSYVGWFYWSIGTQFVLCNPLCTVAYTLASWRFFHERVHEEEMTLLHFFGEQYRAYQLRVPTGLPFIRGHTY
nr:EOG090X0CFU [Polyphemus pediculus]